MPHSNAPIRLLVPYVKDGGSDQRARLIARHLGRKLGRTIDVVNRPGAVSGHQAIADASADGTVLGLITGEIGMMHWHPGLTSLTPSDYTPLAVPFVESSAVIVPAGSPFHDLRAFLEHCRRHPIIGSGGPNFSVWKFSLAGLMHVNGIPLEHLQWIETHSGEQGLEHALAGRAHVAPITMTDARGPLQAGSARALATMEDQRHRSFPDVPTVQEAAGVPWSVAHWRGIVAPRGLPGTITREYVEALGAVADDPDFQAEARASFFTTRWRLGDEFAQYMQEDDKQFGDVIKALGLSAAGQTSLH
ncbi:tripartite tricarboxylate transporter substrate binding protein [Pigmentiphaga sp. GD03639]|uniref:Tripartite tricarboxylate transporter substrate binding protein n=1 Tax=Pigmentiphaga daeguensis TaxID=414049 RepID=A0ABN1CMH1_9BURK|nr:tripartite tricarboxylate transporter substrate binding protein [Pigmentiphaga sp. GD03639]MDH2235702.1 tripartite tricarboxylate transporter substrate binding protein [Pigmentiphaga sp. GD03639]